MLSGHVALRGPLLLLPSSFQWVSYSCQAAGQAGPSAAVITEQDLQFFSPGRAVLQCSPGSLLTGGSQFSLLPGGATGIL